MLIIILVCGISKVRKINRKNRTYDFFDDMINIKNFDLNNSKIDKNWYKNALIYYTAYVTPNRIKPLYLIINNTNGYIGKSNENKYLTLVTTDKSWDKLKEY